MNIRSTLHSRLYRDFMAIPPKDYRGIIRFFEEHEARIIELEIGEYFEFLTAYTDALFEIGAYRQHLAIVDQAIEVSFDATVGELDTQTVLRRMLFRKAASLYQNMDYEGAEYIICELIRLQPDDKDNLRFLRRVRRKQQAYLTRPTRAAAIFLFGLAALVIVIELLFIRPFYDMFTSQVEWTRNFIFLAGWLVLGIGEAYSSWKAYRYSEHFLANIH